MKSFTEEQKKAIYTRGSELLVAAAAGSGKTAVLIERIMNIIEKSVDIDRLLVVTFTEAAAGELRSRISAAIYKRLQDNPQNEHMQRQFILLNKAQITTIHSFCLNVIRKNFYLTDLDPNFRIADEAEIKLLKNEILNQLLEDEYAKTENDSFFELVESYGGRKLKDEGLKKLILDIYHFISNSPWPKNSLKKYVEMFNFPDDMPLAQTPWGEILKGEIKCELAAVLDSIERAVYLSNQPEGPVKYINALKSDQVLTKRILQFTGSFEQLYILFNNLEFVKLSSHSKKDMISEVLKKQVQNIRNKEIKTRLQKLGKKVFIKSPNEMREDILALCPIVKTLAEKVSDFMDRYADAKREKNLVDFNDLEHFCLRILLNGDNMASAIPSQVALELKNLYEEVLIDEYQDSNLIQELALSSICSNRFMVGDIKQSIYKFRSARPEIFLKKYNTFPSNPDKDKNELRIDLSKNFRSRPCVLNAVNFFFYQLMTGGSTEIEYDAKSELNSGAIFPEISENTAKNVEIHLIRTDTDDYEDDEKLDIETNELSKIELEAQAIANRINELVNGENRLYVFDNLVNEYRPAEYRDIVIIVRSLSTSAQLIMEVLRQNGIPSYANVGGSYFDSLEIMTMISFLQIVDNPRQDVHLITVLYSPVYFVNPDELLLIRKLDENTDFYSCVKKYLIENANNPEDVELYNKLDKFSTSLEHWRSLAVYTPISRLINIIYEDTDYYNYVGAMHGGQMRQANLRTLAERAIKYEKTSYKGLFHFIRYVEKIRKESGDTGEAKLNAENANVINIMTIHKSKGLEFPIVFASMLGRGFNTLDEKNAVLLHQELGFGPMYVELKNRIKSNSMPRMAIAKKIHQESLAEELRNFYVALTRAKELLILTGITKNDLDKYLRFAERTDIKLPDYAIFSAKSYLEWMMYCLMRHHTGLEFMNYDFKGGNTALYKNSAEFKIYMHDINSIINSNIKREMSVMEKSIPSLEVLNSINNINSEAVCNLEQLLWRYPFEKECSLPQKISISEIKRIYQREMITDTTDYMIFEKPIFNPPEFLQGAKKTNSQKGTIIHTVLEHMDLQKENKRNDIEKLITRLCDMNLLEPDEAELVNIEKLIKFSRSRLAARMRKASFLKQEMPFVIGLAPYEIFPFPHLKDSELTILVHGIIDCFFEENGEIVLVDYKTDYVKDVDEIVNRYSLQISIYKKAVMKSIGKPIKKCVLYLFGIDSEVEVPLTQI